MGGRLRGVAVMADAWTACGTSPLASPQKTETDTDWVSGYISCTLLSVCGQGSYRPDSESNNRSQCHRSNRRGRFWCSPVAGQTRDATPGRPSSRSSNSTSVCPRSLTPSRLARCQKAQRVRFRTSNSAPAKVDRRYSATQR